MTAAKRRAVSSPDAALIAACDQVHTANAALDRLFAQRLTIADEERTEAELNLLWSAVYKARAKAEALLPPSTLQGVIAVARASLAEWPMVSWKPESGGFHTVAAVSVLQFLTEGVTA